jgi:hypothetical protein
MYIQEKIYGTSVWLVVIWLQYGSCHPRVSRTSSRQGHACPESRSHPPLARLSAGNAWVGPTRFQVPCYGVATFSQEILQAYNCRGCDSHPTGNWSHQVELLACIGFPHIRHIHRQYSAVPPHCLPSPPKGPPRGLRREHILCNARPRTLTCASVHRSLGQGWERGVAGHWR